MKTKPSEFAQTLKTGLTTLVKAQQFDEATRLLNRTNVGDEPDGWNGSICEALGDLFYATDKPSAEWFYRESLRRFEKFAANPTSSGDAMERNSALGPVGEKLQYLCSGAAWPYVVEIPEDVILRHFLRWAESSCLRDFANKQLTNENWSTQSARVIAFLEDRHTPGEMVYQLAHIPLRLFGSYRDPTGILASWLRVALPRLATQRVFTPELEDTCRIVEKDVERDVERDQEPASEEIAGLVKDYLRAAGEAPARDSHGNRRPRSLLSSAPSSEEDLVENLLDRAREGSGLDKKLRGMRAGSPAIRSSFYAQFLDHCSAEEACEMIDLLVGQGQQGPQGRASGSLEQWAKLLFASIERRKLRAPDMLRHSYQGLVGSDFPQGLRRQIVNFLLAYGSRLDGYRDYVIAAFGYDLYSSGTYQPMSFPSSPKTWREWEYDSWAICERDWAPAVLLFALDPPAEREMLKVLEAPLDSHKPSPMFLPSLILFHLWNGAGLSADGLRAVARHMETARRMSHSSFLYLYDRAVLVFHKWFRTEAAAEDTELLRAAEEVARALATLAARMGPEAGERAG